MTFIFFNEDAEIERERTDVRMVYRFVRDGKPVIEINVLGSRGLAYQVGDRVIAFGGQRMPCRKSAREAIARMQRGQ